jgi:uncharacterized protein
VFPCNNALHIAGPAGRLEALTTCPTPETKALATVVICHPHPLHGGTMQNKVVHTLARSFGELGLRTVRFNFRGVGQSEGSYANAVGETEDALAVIEWVRGHRPSDDVWVAGFSFGAYVAMRVAARVPVARLTLVAPPVHLYRELGPPPTPTVSTLLLQGEDDEVVPVTAVREWVATLDPTPTVRYFPAVGHYFHGKLNELRAAVQETWTTSVPR